MTGRIEVRNILCRSNHGCLREEEKIGGNYRVNVTLTTDFSKSFQSDELVDTVDYCRVAAIVQEEMAVRSKLIEHVADRIMTRLCRLSLVKRITLEVVKCDPPIPGRVGEVAILLEKELF